MYVFRFAYFAAKIKLRLQLITFYEREEILLQFFFHFIIFFTILLLFLFVCCCSVISSQNAVIFNTKQEMGFIFNKRRQQRQRAKNSKITLKDKEDKLKQKE